MVAVDGYTSLDVLDRRDTTCTIRARRNADQRLVQLVVLDPKLTRHEAQETAFLERGRQALEVRHPNLVSLLAVGTDEETGLHYIVADLVEGQPLSELLEEEGQFEEIDALAIGQTLCDAIACIEDAGLVHGGVGPSTVTVDDDSTPRLAAIGIGYAPSGGTTRSAVLSEDAFYTAPERGRSLGDDVRSDLYAVGVLLYRMLTGEVPFRAAQSVGDLVELRERHEIPDVRERAPDVAEGTARLIGWLVARDPDARYRSAREAALDIVRVMTGQDPEGPSRALRGRDTLSLKGVDAKFNDSAYWGQGSAYAFKVTVASRDVVLQEYVFNKESVVIGRNPTNDVPIDNPIVSRRHAEVQRHGQAFTLVALSATNPTELKGRRVKSDAPLEPGETFVLSEKFHVTIDWAPGEAPPSEPRTSQVRRSKAAVEETAPTAPPAEPEPPAGETGPYDEAPAEDDPYALPSDQEWSTPLEEPPPADAPYEPEPTPSVAHEPAPCEPPPARTPAREAEPQRRDYPPAAAGLPRAVLVYARSGAEVRSSVERGFQVGGSAVCDLRLPRGAPRKVALVIRCADAYRLYNVAEDGNRVLLNGEPVPDQAVLEDGDWITVWGLEIEFRVVG